MNYIFWLILNIGVPVLGPIFLLTLVSIPYGAKVSKGMIFDSVKDGQLFWAAIAMSASALYELFTGLDKLRSEIEAVHEAAKIAELHLAAAASSASQATVTAPSEGHVVIFQIAICVFFVIALASAFLVMFAGLKTYHDQSQKAAVAAVLASLPNPPVPVTGPATPTATTAGNQAAVGGSGAAGSGGNTGATPNEKWNGSLKASIWLTGAAAFLFGLLHPFAG